MPYSVTNHEFFFGMSIEAWSASDESIKTHAWPRKHLADRVNRGRMGNRHVAIVY
jgi:hypothetical protein